LDGVTPIAPIDPVGCESNTGAKEPGRRFGGRKRNALCELIT
jgi:hypothetical protein